MIRRAIEGDIARILEIYNPYITDTAITFEYTALTAEEFLPRFRAIAENYPFLVYEEDGVVAGYCYADRLLLRAAYAWSVDLAVYIAPEFHGRGIGRALYAEIERLLEAEGYRNLWALVTSDNVPSHAFHERMGYHIEGILRQAGYKFDRWHDVTWFSKRIGGSLELKLKEFSELKRKQTRPST